MSATCPARNVTSLTFLFSRNVSVIPTRSPFARFRTQFVSVQDDDAERRRPDTLHGAVVRGVERPAEVGLLAGDGREVCEQDVCERNRQQCVGVELQGQADVAVRVQGESVLSIDARLF